MSKNNIIGKIKKYNLHIILIIFLSIISTGIFLGLFIFKESVKNTRIDYLVKILTILDSAIIIVFLSLIVYLIFKKINENKIKTIIISISVFLLGILFRQNIIKPRPDRWLLLTRYLSFLRNYDNSYDMLYNYKTRLWQIILRTFSLTKKPDLYSIFDTNIIICSILPIAIYFLIKYSSNKIKNINKIALIGSIASFFCMPFLVMSSTESYVAFAGLITIIPFIFLFKYLNYSNNNVDFLVSLASLFLAINIKPEYILVLYIFFATLIFNCKSSINNKTNTKFLIISSILFFLIIIPSLFNFTIYYANAMNLPGMEMIETSDSNLNNFMTTFKTFIQTKTIENFKLIIEKFSITTIIFSLIGIIYLLKKDKKMAFNNCLFFIIFFLGYTGLVHSSIDTRECAFMQPIIILFSIGIYTFYKLISKLINIKKLDKIIFTITIISIIGISFLQTFDQINFKKDVHRTIELEFIHNKNLKLNENCIFLSNGEGNSIIPYTIDSRSIIFFKNENEFHSTLTNLEKDECYYYTTGYYNKKEDLNEPMQRIYDDNYINIKLEKNNFKKIFEDNLPVDIDDNIENKKIVIYYKSLQ
jgi:hypothetical protein